jgi:hypothetical protein
MLYAVGQFLLTGTRALTPGFAKFNGAIWLPCDIAALPGAGISYTSIAVNANYQLIGMSTPGGNTLFSGTNAFVTYTGTAGTNPRIFLDNSTGTTAIRIYQLYNTTTGKTIYFDYNIAIGELLTIEITPSGVVINSNYGGSKPGAILPGSDTYSFGFQPGVNKLTFTTSDRSSSNFSAYILYKNVHWSFNGGVY